MALKAYTLDLALQTSTEFAVGHTIPNVEGIATDGLGFIPTKNSTNKTIALSKGFGKFGGRLFEMTEQTVYSWDSGTKDANAYLVIDLTKQNSFTGNVEDGTYEFVDNQSSIVLSDMAPTPSANTLVYLLDGNYETQTKRKFNSVSTGTLSTTGAISANTMSASGPVVSQVKSYEADLWLETVGYIQRSGNVVTVYLSEQNGTQINDGYVSPQQLPVGYRPMGDRSFMWFRNSTPVGEMRIRTDGHFVSVGTMISGRRIANFSYLTNEPWPS